MRALLGTTVVVALLTGACGGSDDAAEVETPTTASVATDPPATDPPATDPPATDPPATDPPATDPPPSDPPATDPPVEDPPPPEIVEVFTEDGELGLSYTSRLDGPVPTIRLLDPAEWPAELAGADPTGGVKIYELEPDGAVFDEPVTVTRRLDIAAFAALEPGPLDVPLLTMLTQSQAGDFELLDDLSIGRIGPDIYVSGTTTHFSPIIVSNENRMIPWGPSEDLVPAPPSIDQTTIDPDEMIRALVDHLDAPPLELVIVERRWASPEEAYALIQKRLEEQAGDTADREPFAPGGYGLLLDDGDVIESEPLPPLVDPPTSDDAGFRAERYGTSFPFVPISALPSTSALLGDDAGTVAITVWTPGLVVSDNAVIATDGVVVESDEADPEAEVDVSDPDIADCIMYLEMYPELLEKHPTLLELCETDTAAARAIISDEIYG